MKTITVDDRQLVVNSITRILRRIDPEGTHLGEKSASGALAVCRELKPDIAFLDIEMPDMTGIELAEHITKENPATHIVFITGHQQYALNAFQIHASGYLMKPVLDEDTEEIVSYLSTVNKRVDKSINVHCFGTFEVYYNGKPLKFARTRTKELFAFLIDRNGAMCSIDMICGNLYPDKPLSTSVKSSLRNLIFDLKTTLYEIGCEDVLLRNRGMIGIDRDKLSCDYFSYLKGEEPDKNQFKGEYMTQYAFAEETRANLVHKYFSE